MNNRFFVCLFACFVLCGCRSNQESIEPQIRQVVQDSYIKKLPSAFSPLTPEELSQGWSKEYLIGLGFAKKLDLYQAMTAFKRAEILLGDLSASRKKEIEYDIILCYYLGGKYNEVTYNFENSSLMHAGKDFPAFHDLLIIMYDAYEETGQPKKAEGIAQLISYYYPQTEEKLEVSSVLINGDIPRARELSAYYPSNVPLHHVLKEYDLKKKSTGKAQLFNALMPGAGYLYLGQKQSAFTAFMLNALFIAATYEFLHRGYNAAGIIFGTFEVGWYVGGIYGARQEARLYNERVYERIAMPVLYQEKLFPVLMIQYAF